MTSFALRLATGVALLALAAPAGANPVFTLSFVPGTGQAAQNAFTAAAAAWSAVLADNVTVNLTVGTAQLDAGVLASTGSAQTTYSYAAYRSALAADATSANDAIAVANLPTGSNLSLLINHTTANAGATYLDTTGANTSTLRVTNALAKAVGLTPVASNLGGSCIGTCDGYIVFSTSFGFDTDPSDGITAGLFDFVGIAMHEIGHALGFISGVDVLDSNGGLYADNLFTYVSPLDLYRCSTASAAVGARDWTASTSTKSFSIDGCATSLATFSTGVTYGDGRQASHWKDDLGLGLMDPTFAPGEQGILTPLDLIAFDTMGWNLAAPVPAPASALVFVLGLAGLGLARRRGRAGG